MDSITQMLERARAYRAANDPPTLPQTYATPNQVQTQQVPLGQGMAPPIVDSVLEAKLEEYRNKPLRFSIDPKYENLPDISENMKPVTLTFDDDRFIREPTIILQHFENIDHVCEIGRIVIPMMTSGFSLYGVGAIFVLAYHLQDPLVQNSYLFPTVYGNLNDVPIEELSTILTQISHHQPLPPLDDTVLEAKAYSYLAASLLRLFTKPVENYVNAFHHILNGFQSFYGVTIPIAVSVPDIRALKTFTYAINHGSIFKMTLYKILYAGGAIPHGEGLRKFLYELHLANTGLHIISIFVKLCKSFNCEPEVLLKIIKTKEYEKQTDALMHMITLITDDSDNHKRKMWKYGRLFDDTFMSTLQTKKVPFLVYVLAAALKLEGAKSNEGIMKITHFDEINPDRKRKGDAIAERLVGMIRGYYAQTD